MTARNGAQAQTSAAVLTFKVEHVPDPFPDLSHYGIFTNKPTVPCWDRHKRRVYWSYDEIAHHRGDPDSIHAWSNKRRGEYRYIDNFEEGTVAEHAKAGRKERAEAVTYIRQDVARLEAYERGEWAMMGVVVKAYACGVKLAQESVWGIEDDDSGHLEGCEYDVTQDAKHAALAKLRELAEAYARLTAQNGGKA